MRGLLLVLALAGCVRGGVSEVDPTLPDNVRRVERRAPSEVLALGAADDDPVARARALELLIRLSDEPAGGAWARRALFDPEPWVQRKAVVALAERTDEPETRELLRDWVVRSSGVTDPYVRCAGALALYRAGERGLSEPLRALWVEETEAWRAAPLQLAAVVYGDTSAFEPLSSSISRGDLALEIDFVLEVGQTGAAALLPAFQEGQEWVEEELSLPYAVARAGLGDAQGFAVLRQALTDPDEQRRLESLDYISRLEGSDSVALLRRARTTGGLAGRYAELALAARGEAPIAVFESAIRDPDRAVRVLAVRFVADAGERLESRKVRRLADRILRQGLEDSDPVVRLGTLRSLGRLGLGASQAFVQRDLTDEYVNIRVEAAGALLLQGAG